MSCECRIHLAADRLAEGTRYIINELDRIESRVPLLRFLVERLAQVIQRVHVVLERLLVVEFDRRMVLGWRLQAGIQLK